MTPRNRRLGVAACLLTLSCAGEPTPTGARGTIDDERNRDLPPPSRTLVDDRTQQRHTPATPPPHEAPKLERVASDRYRIPTPKPVESITATPAGVAFVMWGVLWHARLDTQVLEKVEEGTDLHAVESDDESLYWLGRFGNGRYDYDSGEKQQMRTFAGLGMQASLAIGRFPYGLASDGSVWKIGKRLSQINPPMEHWRVDTTILVGGDVLMVRALDVEDVEDARDIEDALYRIQLNEKGRRKHREAEAFMMDDARFGRDALDDEGRLVFERNGSVFVLGPRSKKPERLFDDEQGAMPCWCGGDVCVLGDSPVELRRHDGMDAEHEVIATSEVPAYRLRCSDAHLAWLSGQGANTVVNVLSLADARRDVP